MCTLTRYRVCSRLAVADLSAEALDALTSMRGSAVFDGRFVTIRRDLCRTPAAARVLLERAADEFRRGEHWVQIIRFDLPATVDAPSK
jgi:hypothetical protein